MKKKDPKAKEISEKESKKKPKKRSWKRIFKWLLVLFILFCGVSWGAMEYTSRSSFCKSCHYMVPFYESWAASSHSNVECIQCHFEPGLGHKIRGKLEGLVQLANYISQVYKKRKPWAEISDKSCLRSNCHGDRKFEKSLVDYKGVLYSHKDHLGELRRGKKLRCTSCHSQMVQGPHITVDKNTCFLCHFKKSPLQSTEKLRLCHRCHKNVDDPKSSVNAKFSHLHVLEQKTDCVSCHGSMAIGNGPVPMENCYSCHWERAQHEKYSDTELIHNVHVYKHRVECVRCHVAIEHRSPKPDELVPGCSGCHTNTHKAKITMYFGKPDHPENRRHPDGSKASLHIGCEGCHTLHRDLPDWTTVKAGGKKSCERCHSATFSRIFVGWKEASASKIARYREYLTKLETAAREISEAEKKIKAAKLLKSANADLELLEKGYLVHNIEYGMSVFAKAEKQLDELAHLLADEDVGEELEENIFALQESCLPCHYGIEDRVVKYKVGEEEENFVHRPHITGEGDLDDIEDTPLKCSDCHKVDSDYRQADHGKFIGVEKDVCGGCH